mgnify:CR=1 FL=1
MGKQTSRAVKVPVAGMIHALISGWQKGLDFVDFEFNIDPEKVQDTIKLIFKPEYFENGIDGPIEPNSRSDKDFDTKPKESFIDDDDDVIPKIDDEGEDEISEEDIKDLI